MTLSGRIWDFGGYRNPPSKNYTILGRRKACKASLKSNETRRAGSPSVAIGQFRTHAPQQTYNKPWPVLQGPATIAKPANTALLSGEAIEQPVAAGAAEVALAATAIGPARGMR
jgi:hypothetical protein